MAKMVRSNLVISLVPYISYRKIVNVKIFKKKGIQEKVST